MKKTILMISGGIEAVPGIIEAKNMGLDVVVSDGNPNAPGFDYADYKIVADTYGVEETVSHAIDFNNNIQKIDGVICIAADVPLTVAAVASELNLPGIPISAAKLASDKIEMKIQFQKDNVKIPWYKQILNPDELIEIIHEKGCNLVLKPVDSRGARGVLRLSKVDNYEEAFYYAQSFSPTQRVMVEEYLPGLQVSTESVMVNGKIYTPGFSDRNYEFLNKYAPYFIENGGDLPCSLSNEMIEKTNLLLQKAAASMGIDNGTVKGDIVIFNNQPYIIELAARLSGGYFCTHEIPMNSGVNFVQQAIKIAIGEKVTEQDLFPKYNKYISQRYIFPDSGKVVSIKGIEEVEKLSEILFLDIRIKVGDTISSVENHPGRAGVLIASGINRAEAIKNAQKGIDLIEIETIAE